MIWVVGVTLVAGILLGVVLLVSRSRQYSALFEKSTFQQFHDSLRKAVSVAVQTRHGPSVEDGSAFVLPRGIAAGVSFDQDDSAYCLHISLSRSPGPTTHAVASRFGYFVLAMLNKNRPQLTAFFTPGGVHHLILDLDSADIPINSFEETYAAYCQRYEEVSFVPASTLGQKVNAPARGAR